MELFLVCGWSAKVAFGSVIGKLVGAKLKLWDSDPIWGPLPGPCGDICAGIPQRKTWQVYMGRDMATRVSPLPFLLPL